MNANNTKYNRNTMQLIFLNTHVVIQTVYKMVYRQKTNITLDMIFVRNVYMCNWYTIKAE